MVFDPQAIYDRLQAVQHHIAQYPTIEIPEGAFEDVYRILSRNFAARDHRSIVEEDKADCDPLGHVFDAYICHIQGNFHGVSVETAEALCDRTITQYILTQINLKVRTIDGSQSDRFSTIQDLFLNLDSTLCYVLLYEILPNLTILDPACGSGTLLIAATKTLINLYLQVIQQAESLVSQAKSKVPYKRELKAWLATIKTTSQHLTYALKRQIISDNLYAVDLHNEAIEITKLRLYLGLLTSAQTAADLADFPDLDFSIMSGNSLIGVMRVDAEGFDAVGEMKQGNLLQPLAADHYRAVLTDKHLSIEQYKHQAAVLAELEGISSSSKRAFLKEHIAKINRTAQAKLNQLLLTEFSQKLGIKYSQFQASGKPVKRLLTIADIEALHPFHWGYHFADILENRGGFDIIITHSPNKLLKPQMQEFLTQHQALTATKHLEIQRASPKQIMLQDAELTNHWLTYQSQFPHVAAYYQSAQQYTNGSISKKRINLYELLIKQCCNLLRAGGECGLLITGMSLNDLDHNSLQERLPDRTTLTAFTEHNHPTPQKSKKRSQCISFIVHIHPYEG